MVASSLTVAFLLSILLLKVCSALHIMMAKPPLSTRSVEIGLQKRGFRYVIGSDESGRGSIAGPVVVASCCIKKDMETYTPIETVDDSKKLNWAERNKIYEHVVSNPDIYAFTISQKNSTEIDDSNILIATTECFQQSIEDLILENEFPPEEAYSIVDGKKTPMLSLGVPCRPWVKGDSQVYTVALASILAKVTHDKQMIDMHCLYPQYGFDQNKGYPSRQHVQSIHTHGSCPLHRMSFKQVKGR